MAIQYKPKIDHSYGSAEGREREGDIIIGVGKTRDRCVCASQQQAIECKSNAQNVYRSEKKTWRSGTKCATTYLAEEGRLGNQSKIPAVTWRESEVEKNPTPVIAPEPSCKKP